jgi:hypothetical protein
MHPAATTVWTLPGSTHGEPTLCADQSRPAAVSSAGSISEVLLHDLARTLGAGGASPDQPAVGRVLRAMADEARARNMAHEQLAASLKTVFIAVAHTRRVRPDPGKREVEALRELTAVCLREYYRSPPTDR